MELEWSANPTWRHRLECDVLSYIDRIHLLLFRFPLIRWRWILSNRCQRYSGCLH